MTPATILIVDDELQNRKLLEALLEPEGYLTRSAANGEEALVAIARHAPDLILLDVVMPGMDGYQVATLLKADPATSNIPIIMVTAQIDRGARLAGLDAGAEDFLSKPIDRAELWLRVRNLLRLKELGDFFQNHNAILEQQVQARTAELQRFRTAMDTTVDAIFLLSRKTMLFVETNTTACNMLGYTHEEFLELGPANLSRMPLEEIERHCDSAIAGAAAYELVEIPVWRKNGSQLQVEFSARAIYSDTSQILVGVLHDITERKRAEARIIHLNRVYAVLSGINTLIVRVRDRDELFHGACRIAAEAGQFLSADILTYWPESMEVTSGASSSTDARYLEALRQSLLLPAPETQALRDQLYIRRQPVVMNNLQHDLPASLRGNGRFAGGFAACALPLVIDDRTVGVLTLCAREVGFFDAEEMKLLLELADDIAFAVDHLEKAERLEYLAYYDQLTGLANAILFHERLAQHIRAAEDNQQPIALALLDVERFKSVNDALGRPAGDALLKQLAGRLGVCVGSPDKVAHLGADHFGLVFPMMKDAADAARIIDETICCCFDAFFPIAGTEYKAAARVGIALSPNDGTNADSLFMNAEAALKKAKAGGERYLFYSEEMNARVAERLGLESKLRRALEQQEFVLHYQPKIDCDSGRILGVEALIRWNDPATGLVPPVEFIPLLEEMGLILEVGAWALRRAVSDHSRWLEMGLAPPHIAVNVSAIQLRQSNFVETVRQALSTGPSPPGIDLEITESVVMTDIESNIDKLTAIREMGLNIAIDDFGTGYSSLAYLAKLPVQTLKIDRSFVITMLNDPNTLTLVSTMISLAHSLGLKVVAEGVDQEDQAKTLRLFRCDKMQGYLFSKPVPFEEMTALIVNGPLLSVAQQLIKGPAS